MGPVPLCRFTPLPRSIQISTQAHSEQEHDSRFDEIPYRFLGTENSGKYQTPQFRKLSCFPSNSGFFPEDYIGNIKISPGKPRIVWTSRIISTTSSSFGKIRRALFSFL